MSTIEKPRKKRVFLASAQADAVEVQRAIQQFDLDAVTLEQAAKPGASWVDSLHRCMSDADVIVGIMGGRGRDANVIFELGVASGLNKPTLLFLTTDSPISLVPLSGIPYLRVNLRDEDSVRFGLTQAMSLAPPGRDRESTENVVSKPIGPLADRLLAKLTQTTVHEFEDVIYETIKSSGVTTVARGPDAEDMGVDFAVWCNELEPTISNPLLIECRSSLRSEQEVDAVVGRMFRALSSIDNGCGIVVYKEGRAVPRKGPGSLPVFFVTAQDFIEGLRNTGLAEFVRTLRFSDLYGS